MPRVTLAWLGSALLAACAVGPDYVRPEVASPGEWSEPLANGLSAAPADRELLAQWWTTLGDPQLTELVRRAVSGNLDVQAAEARVREARARRVIARSGFFPTLEANASASRADASDSLRNDASNVGGTARRERLVQRRPRRELGDRRVRRRAPRSRGARRRRRAQRRGSARRAREPRGRGGALLRGRALVPGAARDRAGEPRGAGGDRASWSTGASQAGLATELELERARSNAAQTRAQIPALRTSLEQARNGLAVLVGDRPARSRRSSRSRARCRVHRSRSRSACRRSRSRSGPTCAAPRRELAAQTARVGVATARAYPSLTALGLDRPRGADARELFDAGASTWRLAGSTAWVVLRRRRDPRRHRRRGRAARAGDRATSGRPCSTRSTRSRTRSSPTRRSRTGCVALEDGAGAAERAVALAQAQYGAGLVDFEIVLDSPALAVRAAGAGRRERARRDVEPDPPVQGARRRLDSGSERMSGLDEASTERSAIAKLLGLDGDARACAARLRRRWAIVGAVALAVLLALVALWPDDDGVRYTTTPARRGDITVQRHRHRHAAADRSRSTWAASSRARSAASTSTSTTACRSDRCSRASTPRGSTRRCCSRRPRVDAAQAQARAGARRPWPRPRASSRGCEHVREISGGKVPSQQELDTANAIALRARSRKSRARAPRSRRRRPRSTRSRPISRRPRSARPSTASCCCAPPSRARPSPPRCRRRSCSRSREDLTHMELQVSVDEADVGQVKEGQEATFTRRRVARSQRSPRASRRCASAPTATEGVGVVTYETRARGRQRRAAAAPGHDRDRGDHA